MGPLPNLDAQQAVQPDIEDVNEQVTRDHTAPTAPVGGGHDAVEGKDSSGPATGLLAAFLYRSPHPDDEALMGFRTTSQKTSVVPAATKSPESVVAVLLRLPKHMAVELAYSVIPIVMSCIPVLLCGFLTREFRMVIPEHSGSIKELELRAAEMSLPQAWLGCNAALVFTTVVFLMFLVVPRAMWKCGTYCWTRVFVPWYLLNLMLFLIRPVLQAKTGKAETIDKAIFVLNALTTGAAIVTQFSFIGRKTKNPALHKHIAVATVTVILLFYMNRNYINRILNLSNLGKLVYVGVVNPLLMQIFVILVLRLMCRALHNNDSSTSWALMVLGIIWEKAYSRIVISSIDDLRVAALAGAVSAAGSGLVLLCVGFEDKRVYSLIARCAGVEAEKAHKNIDNDRNEAFRTSVHVLDFTVELAMIFAFSTLMFAYNVQKEDGTLRDGVWVVSSVVVQCCTQMGTYAVQIAWVSVIMGIDFMGLARQRCKHWSLVAGVACMWPTSLMCGSMLVQLLCAAPEGSAGHWQYCK